MLFHMLDQVCNRIDDLDPKVEVPNLINELYKMRPNIEADLQTRGIDEDKIKDSIMVLGHAQMVIIKQIPSIVAEMRNILQAREGESAFRCVVASGLAYLVQPRDLLQDDLPGGYGFIDDALLLHESCALSWEIAGDMKRAEGKRKIFQFLFTFVPEGQLGVFQQAIKGLAINLKIMRQLGPMLADMATNAIIANPLQSFGSTSSFGSYFTNYSPNSGPSYSWKSGNSMGVHFPGGGGVSTDGRNIYPF